MLCSLRTSDLDLDNRNLGTPLKPTQHQGKTGPATEDHPGPPDSVTPGQNPAIADIYTEHAHQVVVAKYAPSGFYIASGVINSVDIKQSRPYRLVTGSDDNCAAFFEGPPFKFKFTIGIYIYDGKTGEKVCALGGSKAHDGGIYAISWSPDSTQLLSASGDKTSKIWDINVNSVVNTFTMGSNVLDQQLGCLWQKDHLLSISLSGYINYLDKNNPSKPLRVIKPKCVAVGPGGYTVVVCIGQIVLLKDQRKCFSIDSPGYEPEVVAVHPGGETVAIGGADGNVRLYSILGTTLKDEGKLLEAKGPVTDLAYSHDGAFLAVCDASKVVTVFSIADGYSENNVFYGHHAKIVCLAWSPDNEHFASGGMDMMVYVWTLSDPETRVKIQDAHRLHHVSSLAWLDEHTLVTTSHDASVKEWTIAY
ncbi:hypothetical protein E2I00_012205 [Balaenoptera physalus]|uniref:Anaphase-promoting complex subunit 4 WD40 domain-containing protein n=1 Tax=Balaenoptera physalus TaxID=9770 RepID=A0A643C493_BALPH|nr:hypothetical protein E2I00_012205 [Balaenoptera physalus]